MEENRHWKRRKMRSGKAWESILRLYPPLSNMSSYQRHPWTWTLLCGFCVDRGECRFCFFIFSSFRFFASFLSISGCFPFFLSVGRLAGFCLCFLFSFFFIFLFPPSFSFLLVSLFFFPSSF